jgi:hypothetical protein
LRELNLGRCIAGYSDVFPLNIVSSETFTRHNLPALLATHFVSEHMEGALSPRAVDGVSWGIKSMVFYTDGSLKDGCARFAFHRTEEGGFGYKISSPAAIFIPKLTALFVTLRHIWEVIQ